MAPEQFHGKAVFASDIYSLGVTMYQLLTGDLPYEAPAPGDIDRLFRTDLITPPRLRNPAIPKRVNDIVLKAMAPDLATRYGKASELIEDLLDSRAPARRPTPDFRVAGVGAGGSQRSGDHDLAGIERRLRARDTPAPSICWKCRKALASRATRCPFCNEIQ
jgi:serine/threonine-protein kinase